MPVDYTVELTRGASTHLDVVFNYIAPHSPAGADKTVRRMLAAIDSLSYLPHRYRVVRTKAFPDVVVHSLAVPPYAIRYHVEDATPTVTILDVRHGRRRPNGPPPA